jgi:hypothetical protein
MKQRPFLAHFFEHARPKSDSEATGTETFTEVRREETDRDVEALAPLGTETGTHIRREDGDRDPSSELMAGTETFTRSRGEEGDRDMSLDDSSDSTDSPGIWETTIL